MASIKTSAASFADDLAFLQKHTEVITLSDKTGHAQVAVVPAYQGRIMTSTATGADGLSYGWINRELVAAGKFVPHINVFGGEDRFWLGPEGGQFSIFFGKNAKFDLEHWFTPAPIDTEPFKVVKQAKDSAQFRHNFQLTNFSGTIFDVQADRAVRLLTPSKAWKQLALKPTPGVKMIAVESVNKITNKGKKAWTTDTGLLSIWILGMFNPSPATTIVVPIKPGSEAELGKAVNADYFGRVPAERLVVKDKAAFFSGDGQYRSKIGVGPKRALPIMGSYDAANNVLTLAQFTMPTAKHGYVNSMWEIQKEPFGGDVANSYNDGPPSPGAKPLGPFYELESSSPAAALAPGKSLEHVHRTIHLIGPKAELDAIAKAKLGVGLDEITTALPKAK
ncbi:MAG: hypothetical protein HZA90_11760 [Verrucomicrobia bacterium]|nr:hypothetical protein [Verrucomicrobiota bacterium]